MSDHPVPGHKILSDRKVTLKLSRLVNYIDQTYGTNNGATTLYWHLINVVEQHLKDNNNENTDRPEA